MSITVKNGVATIEVGSIGDRYLGCTSDKGVFPPVGLDYDDFTFAPEKGTSGVLVFTHRPSSHSIYGGNHFLLFQYHWVKGKLVVEWGVPNAVHPFSESKGQGNFGLMVQHRNRIYVTHQPDDSAYDYHLVDLMTMVSFLAGSATFADLERNARHVRRRRTFEWRLKELQTMNAALAEEAGACRVEIERCMRRIIDLQVEKEEERARVTRATFFARMLERVLDKRPIVRFVFRKLFSLNDHEWDAVYVVEQQARIYNKDNPRFDGYPDLT